MTRGRLGWTNLNVYDITSYEHLAIFSATMHPRWLLTQTLDGDQLCVFWHWPPVWGLFLSGLVTAQGLDLCRWFIDLFWCFGSSPVCLPAHPSVCFSSVFYLCRCCAGVRSQLWEAFACPHPNVSPVFKTRFHTVRKTSVESGLSRIFRSTHGSFVF